MVKKFIYLLEFIFLLFRYFLSYLGVIIIAKYELIYKVGETEIRLALILAIIGTIGIIIKIIRSLIKNTETPETKVLKKIFK